MSTSASSAAGGQSIDQARGELEARPGLTEVSVTVNKTVSGLQTHRRIWLEATTDATDSGAQKELVEYLLALGWSINDVDADKGISVRLHTNPQVVVGDLVKSSWSDLEYRSSPDSFKELVVVPRNALEEKLGSWPGPVPASA